MTAAKLSIPSPDKASKRSVKRAVSIPAQIFVAARRKAEAEGRSFSNYIQALLVRDLSEATEKEGASGRPARR